MKFKIDHNLPIELAELIRDSGHEAMTAAEQGMAEADDDVLAEHCRMESRCIVTLDMGFASIKSYPPDAYPGIVVLRARRQDKPTVLATGQSFVRLLDAGALANRLWILEPDRIRMRS